MAEEQTIKNEMLIYEAEDGDIVVDVRLVENMVWLSLNQLADLFDRDKSTISRHLSNIFSQGELDVTSVVAFFTTTAADGKKYKVEYYNLDAIISVGYRVNSKRGIQFRRWASQVLQDYLIQGFSINQRAITDKTIKNLEQTIELMARTLVNRSLVTDLGASVIDVIHIYSKTWATLLAYDEDNLSLDLADGLKDLVSLDYEEVAPSIICLKKELISKGEATDLFGLERHSALQAILGNLLQTFDGKPVYPTNIERAAHLLYFVIKDHPFSDGNKRIACFSFLLFLSKANVNFAKISDNTLIAMALLVAESAPIQKEIMVQLVMKLIED